MTYFSLLFIRKRIEPRIDNYFQNKVKFLNGLYWYFCYIVANLILSEILLIFEPSWERRLEETNLFLSNYNYDYFENIVTILILFVFLTGTKKILLFLFVSNISSFCAKYLTQVIIFFSDRIIFRIGCEKLPRLLTEKWRSKCSIRGSRRDNSWLYCGLIIYSHLRINIHLNYPFKLYIMIDFFEHCTFKNKYLSINFILDFSNSIDLLRFLYFLNRYSSTDKFITCST